MASPGYVYYLNQGIFPLYLSFLLLTYCNNILHLYCMLYLYCIFYRYYIFHLYYKFHWQISSQILFLPSFYLLSQALILLSPDIFYQSPAFYFWKFLIKYCRNFLPLLYLQLMAFPIYLYIPDTSYTLSVYFFLSQKKVFFDRLDCHYLFFQTPLVHTV